MATTRKGPKNVTAAHKAAMATGRTESRVVSAYLEALAAHAPRRGRRRTPETIQRRLEAITVELDEADMLTRLLLTQERFNLETELDLITTTTDNNIDELETAFVKIASQLRQPQRHHPHRLAPRRRPHQRPPPSRHQPLGSLSVPHVPSVRILVVSDARIRGREPPRSDLPVGVCRDLAEVTRRNPGSLAPAPSSRPKTDPPH